jgi:hypothetical protein
LIHSLVGHTDRVSLTESHPVHVDILLTGGHDGTVFLWDVKKGTKIFHFETQNMITAISFSPNGSLFAVSNNRGIVHMFGIGHDESTYSKTPVEQFFRIDALSIREDNRGNLFEVESGLESQYVDCGPLMSQFRAIYSNIQRPAKFDYSYDLRLIEEDRLSRLAALEVEKRTALYGYIGFRLILIAAIKCLIRKSLIGGEGMNLLNLKMKRLGSNNK